MSAIAGTYYLDGRSVEAHALERMLEAMLHRGPDGRGRWREGSIGLGHLMLHTTPESLSEQLPLSHDAVTLTADARIDNRDELIALFKVADSISDSALILHAYERWGEACVEHLLGDFAFAIWDGRAQKLFCARDHFGIRPFYYHYVSGQHFICATEIKALLTQEGVPARLNEQRVVDYLTSIRNDAEVTIYDGILRLPPAHTLTVNSQGLHVRRYWTLTPAEGVVPASDEEYTAQFLELFKEAVQCRVRSAFPIGTELSGGLDSSFVSCMARDLCRTAECGPVHAFSVIYDHIKECDERTYIDPVLSQGGFLPHFVAGDAVGPLTHLDDVYGRVLDDFLVGGNYALMWRVGEEAQQAGVRVVLNGIDGDTVVQHGELYLKELAQAGDWAELSRQIALLSQNYQDVDHKHPFQEDFGSQWEMFKRYVLTQLRDYAQNRQWWAFVRAARQVSRHFRVSRRYLYRLFWRELVLPESLWKTTRPSDTPHIKVPPVLNNDTVQRFKVQERLAAYQASEAHLFDSVREMQRIKLTRPRLGGGFEAANHFGAAFGLEPRYPFMDVRLVRFCLALPSNQSLDGGWTRLIMRRAMKGIVPNEVRQRVGKARLAAGFRHGLLHVDAERLQKHIAQLGPLGSFVDHAYVQDLFSGRETLADEQLPLLARIAILSHWLKTRFSGSSSGHMLKQQTTNQFVHDQLLLPEVV